MSVAPSGPARYAVVGHPVAHSLSPQLHAAFGAATGRSIDYVRLLAPLDGFADTVCRFFDDGGRGCNVTLPFKLDAHALCDRVSERAARAGAVNCIAATGDGLVGDNTDGVGLVADLHRQIAGLSPDLQGSRMLLLGAGGAARGVLGALLDTRPAVLVIANRDEAKASSLVGAWRDDALRAAPMGALGDEQPFDVIVNATSASLGGASLPIAPSLLGRALLVYDMMYASEPSPFLVTALGAGAARTADGLGMLVEQAAESFRIWHGVRPPTDAVLAQMRALLATRVDR